MIPSWVPLTLIIVSMLLHAVAFVKYHSHEMSFRKDAVAYTAAGITLTVIGLILLLINKLG